MSADQFSYALAVPQCWLYRHDEPLSRRQQSHFARNLLRHALVAVGWASEAALEVAELPWDELRPQLGVGVSISHTNTVLAVALAPRPLGVDVEIPARQRNWLGMARAFFSEPEFTWLEQQAEVDQQGLFLRMWTLKEAALKALGGELLEALGGLRLVPPGDRVIATGERLQALRWCWSGCWNSVHLALAGTCPIHAEPLFWLCDDLVSGACRPAGEELAGSCVVVDVER